MAATKITAQQLKAELEAGNSMADIARRYGVSERVIYKKKSRMARQGWEPCHGTL